MTDVLTGATVLDTSVLSNFAHVDRIELLSPLPRVVTVPAVRDELRAGVDTHGYLERALIAGRRNLCRRDGFDVPGDRSDAAGDARSR